MIIARSRRQRAHALRCSNEGLNVALALSVVVKSEPPVLVAEGLEEGADGLVEEAAEAHPEVVEVPSDHPGGGKESRRFNELYKELKITDIP